MPKIRPLHAMETSAIRKIRVWSILLLMKSWQQTFGFLFPICHLPSKQSGIYAVNGLHFAWLKILFNGICSNDQWVVVCTQYTVIFGQSKYHSIHTRNNIKEDDSMRAPKQTPNSASERNRSKMKRFVRCCWWWWWCCGRSHTHIHCLFWHRTAIYTKMAFRM